MKLETDETRFLDKLRSRMRQFSQRVSSKELPASFACFELLCSIYSAKDIDQEKVASAFPSQRWRDDAVLVPRAILAPIVRGWVAHREGEADLSKAMGLAAEGKGKKPTVKGELTRERDVRLSNQVVVELIQAELNGTKISVDAACATVQEQTQPKVTYRVVERAYRKFGSETKKSVRDAIGK